MHLPLITHEDCEKRLQTTRLGKTFHLDESFICAGSEEGRDACKGDGGNPLVCQIGNNFFQIGIVSWGIDCGINGVPGVYTNVAKFTDWIRNELDERHHIIKVLQNR